MRRRSVAASGALLRGACACGVAPGVGEAQNQRQVPAHHDRDRLPGR